MAKKMVGVWLEPKEYDALQEAADRQVRSMSSMARMIITLYLQGKLVLKEKGTDMEAAKEITPNWDEDVLYGEPDACPACGKSQDELGQKLLVITRDSAKGGNWSCRGCYRHGRWFDNEPPTIVEETEDGDLPLRG